MNKITCSTMVYNFLLDFQHELAALKVFGLGKVEDGSRFQRAYKLYSILVHLCFSSVFALFQIIHLFGYFTDLREFAENSHVSLIVCNSINKVLCFMKYREKLHELFLSINNKTFVPEKAQQKEVLKILQMFKMMKNTVLIMSIFAVSSRAFDRSHQGLPFASWYPFDITKSPVYQFIYVHQCISLCTTAFVSIYTDLIMAGLTNFIGVQCNLICSNLINIQEDYNTTLRSIVNHHRAVLK